MSKERRGSLIMTGLQVRSLREGAADPHFREFCASYPEVFDFK